MSQGIFCTAINCMDGRVQLPVIKFLMEEMKADYVDNITEPGPIKILAERGERVSAIRDRVDISVKKHGSRYIAVRRMELWFEYVTAV